MTLVEARDLEKAFGACRAVAGVSFTLECGRCFGLLGPNGAGKTTTIRILTGTLPPDRGRVALDGLSDPRDPAYRRRLGLAPQALALYDDLTGRENLRFFGRLQGLGGRRLAERAEAALAAVGLEARAGDRVGTYSGGMKRRLNLAVAFVHDPEVLFLDEPTAGVDPQSRNRIFETVEALCQAGKAVLYTTHYLEEAERLCDRVAVMDHGRILAEGTIDELVARHGGDAVVRWEDAAGRLVEQTTGNPEAEVRRLLAGGETVRRVTIERPGLERVFLNLTGRELRDG